MGISLPRLSRVAMKIFVFACVAIAAVSADGDADAYTIAQVRAGIPALKTAYDGQTRVITGVDYGHGLASGHLGYAGHLAAYNGFNTYSAYSPFNTHYIGKREADSEAEPKADADAYTIAQVYNGLPFADAVATGHAHNPGYVAYTSHSAPVNTYSGYLGGYNGYSGVLGYNGLNTHYIGKREAVPGHLAGYTGYNGLAGGLIGGYSGYNGLAGGLHRGYSGFNGLAGYRGHIYKREADSEAEPKADADAYTIAQVYNGLPFADAVATGHAHNPGYVAYTSHSAPVNRYLGGYTGYTGFNRLAGVYHY